MLFFIILGWMLAYIMFGIAVVTLSIRGSKWMDDGNKNEVPWWKCFDDEDIGWFWLAVMIWPLVFIIGGTGWIGFVLQKGFEFIGEKFSLPNVFVEIANFFVDLGVGRDKSSKIDRLKKKLEKLEENS